MSYGQRRNLAAMIGDCHDGILRSIQDGHVDRQAAIITYAIDTSEGKIGRTAADELRTLLLAPAAALEDDWRDRDGSKRNDMRRACSRAWAGLLTALSKHGVIIFNEPEPGEMDDDSPAEDAEEGTRGVSVQ